jgi:hypothetical protein
MDFVNPGRRRRNESGWTPATLQAHWESDAAGNRMFWRVKDHERIKGNLCKISGVGLDDFGVYSFSGYANRMRDGKVRCAWCQHYVGDDGDGQHEYRATITSEPFGLMEGHCCESGRLFTMRVLNDQKI